MTFVLSRIEKNIAKNRPKFLNLYASIYGKYLPVKTEEVEEKVAFYTQILNCGKWQCTSNLYWQNLA